MAILSSTALNLIRYMEVRKELLRMPGGAAALYDGVPDLLLDAPKIAAILQARAVMHAPALSLWRLLAAYYPIVPRLGP